MEIIKVGPPKPKLLTCIVTHNRPDLTKMTIESYLNTVDVDHYLIVVDNGSDQETVEYLQSEDKIDTIVWFKDNLYPGKACNIGWEMGLIAYPEATLLHRSDNDIFFRYRWSDYVINTFRLFPKLGLFGLLDASERYHFARMPQILHESEGFEYNRLIGHDVGGSYVMRREFWDQGIRHIEDPWTHDESTIEDHFLSKDIENLGYHVGHSTEFLACHLGINYGWEKGSSNYEYYKKAYEDRRPGSFDDFIKNTFGNR